ncbi:MAG: DUF6470 family protein [Oscillospiraceae bacterium]|nr:DUF6470 family protein [Oscillospiraceae bacterium]
MPVSPNLLNITTIPISVEINVVKGELRNPKAPKPQIKIETGDGGIKIEASPAKINIDTYAARSSMGLGKLNSKDFYKREADKGKKLAYQGTARIVSEGNSLERGTSPGQLALKNQRAGMNIQTVMEYIPKADADITFEKGTLNINYKIRDVDINWENLKTVPLEFRPGRVDINIRQMPKVIVEYTGGPIYVPPSADPYYSGPKFNAVI